MTTKIERTQETWNPVVGCSKISPGCDNCYAVAMARRLAYMAEDDMRKYKDPGGKGKYTGVLERGIGTTGYLAEWNGEIMVDDAAILEPLHWKKPRRIFVCSMGDLFHDGVEFEIIASVFAVMAGCPEHTFQVLTKRPKRMRDFFTWVEETAWPALFPHGLPDYGPEANAVLWYAPGEHADGCLCPTCPGDWCRFIGDREPPPWPLPNVWLGVTAENQAAADHRIPILLDTPAAVRFVSCEPMLEPIDLYNPRRDYLGPIGRSNGPVIQRGLDWVIAGGESGPGARPMHPDWARILRDQCKAANVPFFFKQMSGITKATREAIPADLLINKFPQENET